MIFFLNEMEKNLRYEPYFSLKFWEKIFLILKTKIDWIVIIIQNKKQEENIILVRAFCMKEILASPASMPQFREASWTRIFFIFDTSKYGKKWRKSLFNFSLAHYYSTKEQRKTQIQVILALFFSIIMLCVISRKKSDGKEE